MDRAGFPFFQPRRKASRMAGGKKSTQVQKCKAEDRMSSLHKGTAATKALETTFQARKVENLAYGT